MRRSLPERAARKTIRKIRALTHRKSRMRPTEEFLSYAYMRHNQRRQEHLASLGLPIAGSSVLETGAGIGDHTSFFLDRGCRVVVTEPRSDNLGVLRLRYPNLEIRRLDLNDPDESLTEKFDIVYCYGTLYHVHNPATALAYLSARAEKLLLLETCVSWGDESLLRHVTEEEGVPSQSISGRGSRPTRRWVHEQLEEQFDLVYMPVTQPNHEEFPVDWGAEPPSNLLTRAIFVASRVELDNGVLTRDIPVQQARH